jgi:hypothetical protein
MNAMKQNTTQSFQFTQPQPAAGKQKRRKQIAAEMAAFRKWLDE